MLLPKGGMTWKSTRSRMPPVRIIWNFLTRTRFLLFVTVAVVIILLWRGLSGTAEEVQRCDGLYFSVLSQCSKEAKLRCPETQSTSLLTFPLPSPDSTVGDPPKPPWK